MKKFKLIAVLLFWVASANSQDNDFAGITGTGQYAPDTLAQMNRFTARNLDGKVYLHWNVSNQQVNGLYIVYRSEDGEIFHPVGQKMGVGTPHCMDLAYYFTDEMPGAGTVYYRVLHLSKELTYLVSESISVSTAPKTTLTATK